MIDRLDRLVDDLRLFVTRVREEHEGAKPFLVGHSMGGAVSLSYAIRHGDTILRPAGPWTPAVHALLRHLEEVGFPASPRVARR